MLRPTPAAKVKARSFSRRNAPNGYHYGPNTFCDWLGNRCCHRLRACDRRWPFCRIHFQIEPCRSALTALLGSAQNPILTTPQARPSAGPRYRCGCHSEHRAVQFAHDCAGSERRKSAIRQLTKLNVLLLASQNLNRIWERATKFDRHSLRGPCVRKIHQYIHCCSGYFQAVFVRCLGQPLTQITVA